MFLPALVHHALFGSAEHYRQHQAPARHLSNNVPPSSDTTNNAYSYRFFFFLIAFWIAAYIFEMHIGAWAHAIVVEATVEVIKEVIKLAHQVAVKGIERCAPPLFFYFSLSADSPQGKCRTGCCRYQDPHRPQCHGIPLCGRCIHVSCFDLQ